MFSLSDYEFWTDVFEVRKEKGKREQERRGRRRSESRRRKHFEDIHS